METQPRECENSGGGTNLKVSLEGTDLDGIGGGEREIGAPPSLANNERKKSPSPYTKGRGRCITQRRKERIEVQNHKKNWRIRSILMTFASGEEESKSRIVPRSKQSRKKMIRQKPPRHPPCSGGERRGRGRNRRALGPWVLKKYDASEKEQGKKCVYFPSTGAKSNPDRKEHRPGVEIVGGGI